MGNQNGVGLNFETLGKGFYKIMGFQIPNFAVMIFKF